LRRVTGVGAYVFECIERFETGPDYTLISFAPGASTTVTLHYSAIGPFPPHPVLYSVTMEYSDQFTIAQMKALLQADLDAALPFDDSLIPRSVTIPEPTTDPLGAPVWTPPWFNDFFAAQRGGVVEREDWEYAIDYAWNFSTPFESQTTRGHAAQWIKNTPRLTGGIPTPRFTSGGVANYAPDAAFLMQTHVYEPGLHSYRWWPLPTGETGPCREIQIPCGSTYLLPPPIGNSQRYVLNLNTSCAG
jgi:hypothetical protein